MSLYLTLEKCTQYGRQGGFRRTHVEGVGRVGRAGLVTIAGYLPTVIDVAWSQKFTGLLISPSELDPEQPVTFLQTQDRWSDLCVAKSVTTNFPERVEQKKLEKTFAAFGIRWPDTYEGPMARCKYRVLFDGDNASSVVFDDGLYVTLVHPGHDTDDLAHVQSKLGQLMVNPMLLQYVQAI